MKFVADLSKGVLGQPDPMELWEEITNHIPDSVLLTPGVKILSVACGHCTEAVVIAKRMIALGLNKNQVNESIYLIDKFSVFTNYAKMNFGFKNVITEDFLEWETDMKFDVVVGNPPYQGSGKDSAQKLWKSFMIKAYGLIKDDSYLAFIVPYSWCKALGPNPTKLNKSINEIVFSNTIVNYNLDLTQHFNVGIRPSFFVIKKNGIATNRDGYIIPCQIAGKILKKMKSIEPNTFNFIKADGTAWSQTSKKVSTKSKEFCIPILDKKEMYTNVDDPIRLKSKIVFPRQFGYSVYADFNGEYALPQSSESVITDDVSSYFKYFNSKLIRFIMKECSWVPQTDYSLMRLLPKVPAKSWTENKLYSYFNLTQEEIDYIEANVK